MQLRTGQRHEKPAAFSRFRFQANAAVHLIENPHCYCEAQAFAADIILRIKPLVYFENLVLMFRINADAIVLDAVLAVAVFGAARDAYDAFPLGIKILERVIEQIAEELGGL